MTQKELFDSYGEETRRIWYYVNLEAGEGKKFLEFAKEMGFIWTNGREIDPETDSCGNFMGVHRDGKMAYVSITVWGYLRLAVNADERSVKRVEFSDGRWIDEDVVKNDTVFKRTGPVTHYTMRDGELVTETADEEENPSDEHEDPDTDSAQDESRDEGGEEESLARRIIREHVIDFSTDEPYVKKPKKPADEIDWYSVFHIKQES